MLNMKKFIINILIACAAISFTSCEGFLDTKPTDQVSSATAMLTLTDATNAVNGLYSDMKWYDYYGSYMPVLGELRADDLQTKDSGGGWVAVYTLDYNSEQSTYFDLWNKCYEVIMRANTILENWEAIPTSTSSDVAVKNDIKGQALATRALVYFDLARTYGYPFTSDNGASLGAVIITRTVSASESRQPRSTVAKTYEQVFSDLETALPLLSRSKNTGHMNYWSAKLLQARAYLYTAQWDKALTAAQEVITSSPYTLVSRANYLNYFSQEGGAETIFELLVRRTSHLDDDGGYDSWYYPLWHGPEINSTGRIIVTQSFINLLKNHTEDIRSQVIKDGSTSIIPDHRDWLGKFPGTNYVDAKMNNPLVMRLSEAYLIAAEAALHVNPSSAAGYINTLRRNRILNYTDVSSITLDDILTERRKEFVGEGHRFFDLMRTGNSVTRSGGFYWCTGEAVTITPTSKKVCLPISHSQRLIYPELQQNPGYTE